MPRIERSKESAIVEFFRTADLTIAVVVMGLCKDALKERTTKSDEAKARAAEFKAKQEREAKKVAAAPAAGKVVSAKAKTKAKAKGGKKSHHKAKSTPAGTASAIEGAGYQDDGQAPYQNDGTVDTDF